MYTIIVMSQDYEDQRNGLINKGIFQCDLGVPSQKDYCIFVCTDLGM